MKAKPNRLLKLPVPVRVMIDDGLVYGKWVGDVTVYIIVDRKGVIVSNRVAEKRPTNQEAKKIGGEIVKIHGNPKIVLDDGQVVYGCQVWWETLLENN